MPRHPLISPNDPPIAPRRSAAASEAPPRDSVAIAVDNNKPRRRGTTEEGELRHPLLGDAPTLQLIQTQSERDGSGGASYKTHSLAQGGDSVRDGRA